MSIQTDKKRLRRYRFLLSFFISNSNINLTKENTEDKTMETANPVSTSKITRNSIFGLSVITILSLFMGMSMPAFAAPGLSHEQCQPGPEAGTNGLMSNCIDNSNPNGWKSGLNSGPFAQGQSLPYRATMTETVVGVTYTLTLEYDVTQAAEHAIDYITTFDRTMINADACSDHGSAAICADVHTFSVPLDPQVEAGLDGVIGTADDITQVPGEFTLYGGTITSVAYTGGSVPGSGTVGDPYTYAGNDTRQITIVYTVDQPSGGGGSSAFGPVLTWAGHIGSVTDWTQANPSGSPYHMRIVTWDCTTGDCSSGQQDLALNEADVITPGSITIIKDSDPNDPQTFDFSISPNIDIDQNPIANLSLFDDGTGTGNTGTFERLDPGTYTITELASADWSLQSIDCGADTGTVTIPAGGDEGSVVLSVADGQDITCTFVNTIDFVPSPDIDLVKTIDSITWDPNNFDDPEAGVDSINYEFVVTNTGNVDLSSVEVIDMLITAAPNLGSIDCPATTLAADPDGEAPFDGESFTCTGSYLLTQDDIDAGVVNNTATAEGTDGDGTTVMDSDSAVQLVDQDASISLDKNGQWQDGDGDGLADPGEIITYNFRVENTGNVTLFDVTLTDLNTGVVVSGGPIASMAPGEVDTTTFTGTYTITQEDIDAGIYENTARVDGDGPGSLTASASATHDEPLPTLAQLTLDKNASPLTYDSVGDVISYTYDVTNSGNVTLAGPITVTDDKTTVTCPDLTTIGDGDSDLDVGETVQCTASYTVDQADIDAGSVTNVATAMSGNGTTSNQDTATVTAVQNPSIDTVKEYTSNADEDGSSDISVGDTLTYTITATNNGNITLTNVTVDDAQLNIMGEACANNLVPGNSCSVQVTYVVQESDLANGEILNLATATGQCSVTDPEACPVTDTDDAIVDIPTPALNLDKSAALNDENQDGFAQPGETITYSFLVSNTGTANLTNLTVTDPLPGLSAIICPGSGDNTIAFLAAGDNTTCTATYTLTQADIDSGSIENTATADSDQTDPVADTEIVILPQNPSLDLVKSASAVDTTVTGEADVANPGDTITYTFTITNNGNVSLSGAALTDALLGLTDATCGALTELAPGDSTNCQEVYVLTQADIDNGSVTNSAQACAMPPQNPQNEGEEICDDDTTTTTVPQDPALSVIKDLTSNADEDQSGTVSLGDTLTYTITATNDGNITLNNVTVSDDLTGDSTACASVAPGGTCVLTTNYTVTQADVDAGEILNIGAADSDETDEVTDPEEVPVPQTPALSVIKDLTSNADEDQSGTVSLGDTLTYTITATNDGNITLNNVTVSDDLTGDSTACASVAPGGTCVLTTNYTVTQADVDAGEILNIGAADSDETDEVTDPEEVPVPQNPALSVIKDLTSNADEDQSGTVSLGDTLTYTITATNDGNITLNNVTVSDDLTGDSTACASVAPGGTCVLTTNYTVTQADVDAGEILNIGAADSDETDEVTDPEEVPVPQTPALSVIKDLTSNADEDQSGTVSLGDTLTYTITATNDGNITLNNVTVSDDLTGDSTACASVAPGGTCVLTTNYTVTQADVDAGEILNIGAADSDETDEVTDPEEVPVPQTPALSVIKDLTSNADEDQSGTVSLGDTLTYTITATNDGNITLNNVTVSDDLTGDSTACASVAPGGTCVLTTNYTVTQADVDAGEILNIGAADSDETDEVTDPEEVPVPQTPALSVIKDLTSNADEDQSGTVSLGDTLTYTITATNDGNITLNNVTVSDDLTGDSTACASVAPGGTCVLTTNYTVTQADVDAGEILNIGAADSDETDEVTDPEEVPVPQTPALSVIKDLTSNADEDQSGTVSLGDTLTYTITATNDGNITLNNVTVSDDLTGDSTACASVAPGGTCVLTTNYTVTQADVDAGEILNIGAADSDETDEVTDPEEVPVPQTPALSVIKDLTSNADEDQSGTVSLGDTLTYTITATNDGNITLNNVTVSDDLTGDSTACASVAPGGTCVLTTNYTVTQADVDAGEILNIGAADSDETDEVTDPEEVPVPQNPALSVIKDLTSNADEDQSGTVSLGDTLTYTITATNDGNITLNNVTVSDDLTGDSTACASVAPGGTCVLTTNYTVTQADVDAGEILNIGAADSDETDEVTDPEEVPVPQNPALSVIKDLTSNADEDQSGTVSLGDTLTYTITATNDGNITLNNVTVSDDLTGDSTACASVAPGGTCVLTTNYTVTQADVDAGEILNIGAADSDETDEVTDPEEVPVPQNPALSVIKDLTSNADEDQSGTVSLGDTLTYTITATNDGNITLNNVTVSDDLTGDSTACASVAPGGTCVLTTNYTVTQADVDAGEILNIGAADSDETDEVTDPEEVPVPQNPSIDLVKEADVSTYDMVGDVITYTFTITNTGDVTLTNVMGSDPLPGLVDVDCDALSGGTMAPGASASCTKTYTITQADLDNGSVLNTATVVGTPPSGDDVTDMDDEEVTAIQTPALSVIKDLTSNADEDQSGTVSLGDTLTYTITATNDGNITLNNVTVSDDLTGDSTACASVAPGGTCVLTTNYTVTQADVDAGEILNIGAADSDETDEVTDPEEVPVPQNPSIDLVKEADVSTYDMVGDVITYTFTITNTGDVTLTNVMGSDPLPGLVDVDCDALSGGTMAPGASASCTKTYTITQADLDNGSVLNTATVVGTPPSGDDVTDMDDEEVTAIQTPALSVIKDLTSNADEDQSGTVSLGDTLTYTITATNDGNITLNNVTVSDDLTGDSTACASVAPGGTCVLTTNYTVTQADVDAGEILNIGAADSDETDEVTDPEEVPVPQNPSIDLVKEADVSTYDMVGDVITYTFTITNTGDVTLTNVMGSDPLPGLVDVDCDALSGGTMAPGASASCTKTYTITQADLDNGSVLNTATVVGTPPSGDDVTDMDDEEVTAIQTPALSVIKDLTSNADEDQSGTVSLGDTLTYTITATNDGNITLNNVTVSDDLTGDSTACASVAPGGTCVLTTNYTVTQADVDAGEILNIGAADSDETDEVTDPEEVPVPQNPSIDLVKEADVSTYDMVGDVITYTFTITNTGDVTLTNVMGSDPLPGLVDVDCDALSGGTMAPGASASCTKTYTITQADLDNGSVLNTATVVGTPPSGDDVTDMDDEEVTAIQTPALSVIKDLTSNADEDQSGTVSLGDTLTYTITATNDGNITLNNVTVSDDLTGDSTACASVAPGGTCVLTTNYTVTQADVDAGEILNIGAADSDETDEVTDPEEVPVPQNPSIDLVKEADVSTYDMVGDVITYTFTITNTGDVTLTNVMGSDPLPGLVDVDCDALSGGTMAPGASASCTKTYTITQADLDNGSVLNTATVVGTPPSGDDVTDMDDEEVTAIQTPALSVIKDLTSNADEDQSGTVSLGDTLTYTITATNDGNITLNNVTVSDDLTGDSTACASVAPGGTCVLTTNYTVTQADVDAGEILNIGAADSDETDEVTDPEEVPVPQNPSIDLVKEADVSTYDMVGDVITYTFTITNTGDVTLTNVMGSDPLPGLVDVDCDALSGGTMAPGASASCTKTYTITQADLDNGSVLNTATVVGTPPSGDDVTDMDDEEVTAIQTPALSVIKDLTSNADEDQSGTVSLGDTLTYTITATNDGNITLNNVTVSDDLTGDSTACASVAPGGTCVLTTNYTVTQADVDAGEILNIGAADSDETDEVTDPEEVPVPQNPSIDLVKEADVSTYDMVGDVITYTFTITNTGDVTLTNVMGSDPLPGLVDVDCDALSGGTMAPGASASCTKTYTITQADLDNGSVLNTATVVGTPPSGDDVTDMDDEEVTAIQTPALSVIKDLTSNADEDQSGTVSLGDTLTYTITATNDGNITLNNVTVSDDLTGDSTACASVAPGGTCVLTTNYTVTQADVDAGEILNIGAADSDETDEVTDPEEVPVPQNPSIDLVKEADVSTYDMVGDVITYTFTITNTGDVTLTNVMGSDPLPGLVDVDCDALSGGTMAPGASASCTKTYTITQADLDNGSVLNTATVVGTPPSGDDVTDMDDEEVTAIQTPALSVIKDLTSNADEDQSGTVSLGDTLTYTITATNDGNITLNNVTVSDDLTGDSTACASVAPGGTCVLTTNYTVTQADVDAGEILNIGAADSDETDEVTDPEEVPVPQNPSIDLVKEADVSTYDMVGDVITYTFTITNTGDVTLTNVMGSDPLPGLVDVDCDALSGGTMAPGASASCTKTYTITQADLDNGSVLNTATVVGTPPSGDDVTDMDDEEVTAIQTPALSVIKDLTSNADEDQSGTVSLGDTLTYTITATNDGNITLNNVTVSDDLTGDSTACASVAPGGTCVLTTNYTVTQADVDAGEILNIGAADSDETDEVTDPEEVPVPQNPSIDLVKEADVSTYDMVGDVITYTFTITNTGDVTLTNVMGSDPLPGLVDVDCDALSGGTMAPGASASCTKTYTITQADLDNGSVLNTATVVGTPPSGDDVTDMDDEEVTAIQTPALSVIKDLTSNADEDQSGTVSLGDTLTYTITATNDGNITLNNVTVSDDLTGDSTACASVAPGGTCVLTTNYTVTQADVDAGEILNIGAADSDETDEVTDPEEVPVPQNPSIDLVKEADVSTYDMVGDVITYTFTITNTGDVTLTNVMGSDPLPGLVDVDCDALSGGTMAPGASASCTKTYTITQADLDNGSVLNTATVVGTPPSGDDVTDMDDEEVTAIQTPALSVIKDLTSNADEDQSGTVSLGDTLTYTITATNDGNITLNNVTVSDDLTGDSTACASVAPGGTCVLTTNYTVTQADVDAGEILNIGAADSDETDEVTDPEEVPVPQNPSIDLVKEADVSTYDMVGDVITYTFTITNTGDVTLTNVMGSDPLPGLVDVDCDALSGGTMAPGASASCTKTYTITQADLDNGSVLNTATVVGTPPSGDDVTDMDDEEVTAIQTPALSVIKDLTSNADEDQSGTVSLGDTLTYTITATNDGNITLNNVTVSDDLTGDSTACASVAPGGTCVLTTNYTVTQADVDAGEILNIGAADSDETDEVTDPEEVPVPQNPALDVVKDFDPDMVSVGDIGSFTITVTNTGNVTLNNVTVTDEVNESLTVLSISGTQGAEVPNGDNQNIAWNFGTLAPGESASITVQYELDLVAPDIGVAPQYGTYWGSEFIFNFVNGSVLYGSSTGSVYLIDENGIETQLADGTQKNDYFFDPDGSGPEPGFEIHLSCSDDFTDGWGDNGGPVEGVDTNWQIESYEIVRYRKGEFHKDCNGVLTPDEIKNIANATGLYNIDDLVEAMGMDTLIINSITDPCDDDSDGHDGDDDDSDSHDGDDDDSDSHDGDDDDSDGYKDGDDDDGGNHKLSWNEDVDMGNIYGSYGYDSDDDDSDSHDGDDDDSDSHDGDDDDSDSHDGDDDDSDSHDGDDDDSDSHDGDDDDSDDGCEPDGDDDDSDSHDGDDDDTDSHDGDDDDTDSHDGDDDDSDSHDGDDDDSDSHDGDDDGSDSHDGDDDDTDSHDGDDDDSDQYGWTTYQTPKATIPMNTPKSSTTPKKRRVATYW